MRASGFGWRTSCGVRVNGSVARLGERPLLPDFPFPKRAKRNAKLCGLPTPARPSRRRFADAFVRGCRGDLDAMVIDEPPNLFGTGTAPNSPEAARAALGSVSCGLRARTRRARRGSGATPRSTLPYSDPRRFACRGRGTLVAPPGEFGGSEFRLRVFSGSRMRTTLR